MLGLKQNMIESAEQFRLLFSDCYFGPLFYGILDRALRDSGDEQVASLVSEWNTQEGWSADDQPVPVAPADATQLAAAIAICLPCPTST